MGGNAIKGPDGKSVCQRLPAKYYVSIKKFVLEIFSQILKCAVINELPQKEDFGDLDLMYIPQNQTNLHDFVKSILQVPDQHMVRNGPLLSFALDCSRFGIEQFFQIDLIKVDNLEMANLYFSYAETGNILGEMLSYHGITFSERGLYCDLYDSENNDRKLGRIMFSDDPKTVCKFIGIDYRFWEMIPMLRDHQEIYRWLITSRFFNPKIFDREKKARKVHRQRGKRPFYANFINFVQTNFKEQKHDLVLLEQNQQLPAIQYFSKESELEVLLEQEKARKSRQSKFSSVWLIEEIKKVHNVEITGKNIGQTVVAFKEYSTSKANKEWDKFLDSVTKDVVQQLAVDFVHQYQITHK
ncbi:MAG: hypothetical protein Dasosvirus6_1 [Dasosvirus sp.]|uniref:Uncharacterized protein n=1 Tax=Dasosvirus sp. TaxID=2487764 RepID=A0A3G4ZVR7_9VIRU|nr:MAG: hypothetical protein Dasosvirus6_1 [Dasosvirus sp.]